MQWRVAVVLHLKLKMSLVSYHPFGSSIVCTYFFSTHATASTGNSKGRPGLNL